MVAELIQYGAKLQPLHLPADSPPEPGYRPSAQLERFIRCRDMTCRFPGCDRPAEFADIDHTIPYPYGPTHASNLKCLCRKHHLLKTFWTQWRDEQHPDGTVTRAGHPRHMPEAADIPPTGLTGPPSADRRGTDRARELADQISDALGHLHRLVRVLDDNELDELAHGG